MNHLFSPFPKQANESKRGGRAVDVPPFQMRGCDCLDVLLLIGGVVLSLVSGAIQPFNSVVFKGLPEEKRGKTGKYRNN